MEATPQWHSFDQDRLPQLESQLRHYGQELHDSKLQIMSLEAQLQGEQHSTLMKQAALQQKDDEISQLRSTIRDLESRLFETERKCETIAMDLDRHGSVASRYQ